jgi:long-chain acyl-CoA synthetase
MPESTARVASLAPGALVTVPQLLRARAAETPNLPAQWSLPGGSGRWEPTTWMEFENRVAILSAVLRQRGLAPGERVGIIAPSSARWDWVQMAVFAARGVVVGLDPYDPATQSTEIASRAGITMLVAATADLAERFGDPVRSALRLIIVLDPLHDSAKAGRHVALQDLLQSSRDTTGEWDHSLPDDVATIVYTSGTTGTPKGIAYTHRQLCLATDSLLDAFADIREGSHLACWLPLSNLFQRIVNTCAIGRGGQTYYVENPREIMNMIGQINPTLFIGVPRFYEKLYAGIMERVAKAPRPAQALAHWALGIGERWSLAAANGAVPGPVDRLLHAIAEPLVLRKMKRVMGSNLHYMISGSAPMPRWLLDRFDAMGLKVLEAYGLSEDIIPVAANTPTAHRFGTVGKPLRGNEVKLASDGEVLVRGAGVFAGYFGESPSTAAFDEDGFLATGDFGEFDDDGFLTLTGRKSEIFKTSTGRRVAPAHVESCLRRVPFVEHAVVVGANRPAPLAVLSVSPAVVGQSPAGRTDSSGAVAGHLLESCTRLRADARQALRELPSFQRPEGFVVTTRPLTIEDGELTSNLKLRRGTIARRYAGHLAELDLRLKSAAGMEWSAEGESDVVLCRV